MPSSAERSASAPQGSPPALCDVVVVGAGPGRPRRCPLRGLGGARRPGRRTVASGGQAGTSARIENYLGFPAGHLRPRVDPEADGPSGQVRGAAERAGRGRGPEERTRPARDPALERRDGDRPQRHRRDRGPVPPPRCPAAGGIRRWRRLLRRHPGRGTTMRRRPGRDRAAAGTRPARRRCSSPAMPGIAGC